MSAPEPGKRFLRILFCSYVNPYAGRPMGGAERSMRLMARLLAARGHDVTYLTQARAPAARAEAARDGVRLVELAPQGPRRAMVRRITRRVRLAQTAALFRRRRIDVVYAFYELDLLAILVAARLGAARPRIVMRMAGFSWESTLEAQPERHADYVRVFSSVDAVNYLEPGMEAATDRRLAALKMPVTFRDSFVADVGASVRPGRDRPYTDLPDRPFEMLMAARFSKTQKRQDILVRAMACLPRDIDVRLTLVGSGERFDETRALIDSLGVGDRVTCKPFETQAELWARMEASHLLCLATDYEGVSKVTLEAMAKGLPVLVSDVDPIAGYVAEGETGFLCPNTPEDWGRRITELAADPALRARVSDGAMAYVADEHDPEVNIARIERAFARIAAG